MRCKEPHHHRRGMPPAGDQPAEIAARRRPRIGMHRLRIVFAGEFEDLGLGDRDSTTLEHRPRRVVREIALGRLASHSVSAGSTPSRARARSPCGPKKYSSWLPKMTRAPRSLSSPTTSFEKRYS